MNCEWIHKHTHAQTSSAQAHRCSLRRWPTHCSLHWRGTTTWAENGSFTFSYYWKGQEPRVASGYKRTGQSPWRISAYQQKAAFLMHCKYLLANSTNMFSSTHLIESKVRPLLVRICIRIGYFRKGGKPASVVWLKCRSGQDSALETPPTNGWLSKRRWKMSCKAGLKSDSEQTGLIDDQCGLTLMRPCCPGPRPVQQGQEFLLTALPSLILFAFPPQGLIVGFNYFATKWYRWKIGVCN